MSIEAYRLLFSGIGALGVIGGGIVAIIRMMWNMARKQAEQTAKVETVRRQVSPNGGNSKTTADATVRLERGIDRIEQHLDRLDTWSERMDSRVDAIENRMNDRPCKGGA